MAIVLVKPVSTFVALTAALGMIGALLVFDRTADTTRDALRRCDIQPADDQEH